jgi:hypothetical protein
MLKGWAGLVHQTGSSPVGSKSGLRVGGSLARGFALDIFLAVNRKVRAYSNYQMHFDWCMNQGREEAQRKRRVLAALWPIESVC